MERNSRRTYHGTVVSDKMNKTRVVEVQVITKHPLYKKRIRIHKRYKMHDENNESHLGDKVKMMETRPLSKDKYFRLVKITEFKEHVDLSEINKNKPKKVVQKTTTTKPKSTTTKKPTATTKPKAVTTKKPTATTKPKAVTTKKPTSTTKSKEVVKKTTSTKPKTTTTKKSTNVKGKTK